jgi:hypothetical protein
MPFITVSRGAPSSDIEPGVYPVTLTEISDPRTVTARQGPKAGQDVDLIDWTFALDNDATIDASTSTASGPKSKMYAYLTALFGGQAPPIGTQLEKDQLIGRMALATIQLDEAGWPRIVNLGALPNTMPLSQAPSAPAVPTDNTAVVPAQRAPRRAPRRAPPAAETMVGANEQPLVPAAPVAAGRDADLPF